MLDYDESTNPSNGWRAPDDAPAPGPVPVVHHARWPRWVYYGGRAWIPTDGYNPGFDVTLPWRVWPVVDLATDNYGSGLIVSICGTGSVGDVGIDALISDTDLP